MIELEYQDSAFLLRISDLVKFLEDESGLILADPVVALSRWELQPPSVPVRVKD